ncbi:hypothetical protein CDAR_527081 [Caerostris darwini]|uniref:Uncharacterized protein n=1 Tax=Caerostris darwini TaxID=1538125 RepID=A0AAV4WJ53_9ARAC|nr:hypothetical protein CDAR_527081 [Caerostris darwini]
MRTRNGTKASSSVCIEKLLSDLLTMSEEDTKTNDEDSKMSISDVNEASNQAGYFDGGRLQNDDLIESEYSVTKMMLDITMDKRPPQETRIKAHFSIFGGVIVENDDDDDDESESDNFQPGIEDISSDSSTSDSDTCDEPSVDNCPENPTSHSLIKDPEAADQNAGGYRDRIPLNYDHLLIQFEDISQD